MSEVTNIMRDGWLGIGAKWLGDSMTKSSRRAESAANDAKARQAADAASAAVVLEEKKKKASALLDQPTSGFGASTNTARQFLTSF